MYSEVELTRNLVIHEIADRLDRLGGEGLFTVRSIANKVQKVLVEKEIAVAKTTIYQIIVEVLEQAGAEFWGTRSHRVYASFPLDKIPPSQRIYKLRRSVST
ncbi:MAG: hypothetical protein ACTSPB_10115 [Candidatus Thorarchaeota archaeon]